MSNFQHVSGSMYIVRTQAGFRNAVKKHTHQYERQSYEIVSVPKVYPSLINLEVDEARGWIVCHAVHLNVLKAAIAQSEATANHQSQWR